MCTKPAIDGKTHPVCRRRYGLDGATSYFSYTSVVRRAIQTIKYRWVSDVAKSIVATISKDRLRQQQIHMPNNAVLIPVPLHPIRRRWRGFNQSELLGDLIAEKLHITCNATLLRRTINTKPQVSFKKKERQKNIRGAFAIAKKAAIPSHVVLFDDVWTTGSTMRECAKVLKQHGVKWVWAVTLAR